MSVDPVAVDPMVTILLLLFALVLLVSFLLWSLLNLVRRAEAATPDRSNEPTKAPKKVGKKRPRSLATGIPADVLTASSAAKETSSKNTWGKKISGETHFGRDRGCLRRNRAAGNAARQP